MKLHGFHMIDAGRKRAPAAGGDRSPESIEPTAHEVTL
jgi:hypothetical protein